MSSVQILYLVCSVLAFIPAIMFHEVAHGYAAYKLGDATAKQQGRLSLNPLKHVDPFGTVILPAILILAGGPVFGYAKPVPYNPHNFKNKRVGDLLVGLAGPAANLVMALLGALILFIMGHYIGTLTAGQDTITFIVWCLYTVFFPLFIMVNLYLMFFNLLPIPPLDGSSIIGFFLPEKYLPQYYRVQQYALPIFLIVIFALPYFFHVNIIGWYLQVSAGSLASLLMG